MYFDVIKWNVVDWIHVAQDREQWRTLVNAVKDASVPIQ